MILLLLVFPALSYVGPVCALIKSDAVFIILDSIYRLCSSCCNSSMEGPLNTLVIWRVNANFLLGSFVKSNGVWEVAGALPLSKSRKLFSISSL
jgi:hypothetical protein